MKTFTFSSYTIHLNSYKFLPLWICLPYLHIVWNVTLSAARSGCIMVPSDWKLTGRRPFPGGSSQRDRQPRCIKRTESVFVQVFHIGPVPDIFLNEATWRTIFGITTFSSLKGPVRSRVYRRLPHFSGIPLQAYCATPASLLTDLFKISTPHWL